MALLANGEGVSDELLTAVAELLKDDFDEKALFEQAVKREYVNFSCWMLDKMGDTLSIAMAGRMAGRFRPIYPHSYRPTSQKSPAIRFHRTVRSDTMQPRVRYGPLALMVISTPLIPRKR